jgi:hypothetical protein
MNARTLIITSIFLLSVTFIFADDVEKCYGTWVNPEYETNYDHPVIFMYTADGKWIAYKKQADTKPWRQDIYSIIDKWAVSEGNIWYKIKWKNTMTGSSGFEILKSKDESRLVYKNVISGDVGDPFFVLVTWWPSVSFVYERRLSNLVSLQVGIEKFGGMNFTTQADVGVNLYPGKSALHGWYLGAFVNIGFFAWNYPESTDWYMMAGGGVRSGYQWVFPSRFVLRLGGGLRSLYQSNEWGWTRFLGVVPFKPIFDVALGYAF